MPFDEPTQQAIAESLNAIYRHIAKLDDLGANTWELTSGFLTASNELDEKWKWIARTVDWTEEEIA